MSDMLMAHVRCKGMPKIQSCDGRIWKPVQSHWYVRLWRRCTQWMVRDWSFIGEQR
jgi:hypothetical protein